MDAEKGRGAEGEVEARVIMRQRYWAGKRQHGRVAVGRPEEGSRSEGDRKERKNKNDLVDAFKNTITAVEHNNDIKKSWQRRGRVRMRRLKDVTSVARKHFADEIKGDVSQGINSAVKERKERIKKRRRKKMRKFPERKTPFQKYTQRNTNEDNKNSSNEDLANEEIIKLKASQEVSGFM